MIQPLRRTHQWAIGVLAVILPGLLLAALVSRDRLPAAGPIVLEELAPVAPPLPQLEPFKDLLAPDVLVYYSSATTGEGPLPHSARLLGTLHGIEAAAGPAPSDGYLLLYSLAHERVIATLPLRKPGDAP
jgi:hypothetical protein